MRAHEVKNFPDPVSSGGFEISSTSGIDPNSPEVRRAQATCQKLLPGAAALTPGSTTHPSSAAMAHMLQVSKCMHRRGISDFPEPRTSIPSHLTGVGTVSDRDTVILVFPSTLDTASAAFARAAAACGFALTNH